MIIDCHAHVFQHWIGACGHESRHIHKRYMQRAQARTVAKTFRARDGARAEPRVLARADDPSWNGLLDVDFRVGRFGQLEFTVDGEDYYIQYMPVGMQEMTAPPELMLAQMTNAGVDHCVLQAGSAYGRMNDYNAMSQKQYPRKITGLMHVDEGLASTPENLAEIDRAYRDLGLRGLYYNVDGFSRTGFAWGLDDARMMPFWDKIASLGIKLCVELSAGPTYDKAGYVANLLRLGRVLDRFRDMPCHLAMGPPVQHFASEGQWSWPDDVAAVYKRENLVIEIMFPITWGGVWDYPYPEAQSLIRDMRDKLGADKLVWGSDMPNVERFCTYTQSLDYVRRYCPFLTAREKDLVLGDNIARFYGITESETSHA
jgi:predicted TIM-barrel fold metal-dependent hydrolase